jgi:deazaflavin-dependent oxidoreductase (nitroreductase family)
MLLTTRGRRTGRPRTTGVSFMPLNDHYVMFSGWGVRSDWYRNVLTHPEVFITVGRRRMRAMARPVTDPSRRRELMLQMQRHSASCGPPQRVRRLLKLSGIFDYDAEITMAVAAGDTLPVVEIFPQR